MRFLRRSSSREVDVRDHCCISRMPGMVWRTVSHIHREPDAGDDRWKSCSSWWTCHVLRLARYRGKEPREQSTGFDANGIVSLSEHCSSWLRVSCADHLVRMCLHMGEDQVSITPQRVTPMCAGNVENSDVNAQEVPRNTASLQHGTVMRRAS